MRSEGDSPRVLLLDVERFALEAAIRPHLRAWPVLATQLQSAEVQERRYTGTGCFTEIVIPDDVEPLRDPVTGELQNMVLHEGNAVLKGGSLNIGATTIAFVRSGYLSCLEIAAYDDSWDGDLTGVRAFIP